MLTAWLQASSIDKEKFVGRPDFGAVDLIDQVAYAVRLHCDKHLSLAIHYYVFNRSLASI
jgi:hypothetical protein